MGQGRKMRLWFAALFICSAKALEIWGSGPTSDSAPSWTGWDLPLLNGTTSLIFSDMSPADAHKHGIRWFTTCGPKVSDMASAESRAEFASGCAKQVASDGGDGANFDYEDPIPFDSALRTNYTLTVAATSDALKKASKGRKQAYQVVVDAAWGPQGVDGRFYDVKGLADASDRLFLMAYDMQSQIFGRCVAQANSPYQLIKQGLQAHLNLGIDPGKLVLGLPWYGYNYPCANSKASDDTDVCIMPEDQWRGINCSDAVGEQNGFTDIMTMLSTKQNVTEVRWDDNMLSPYFNIRVNGMLHQVWYEDPRSLAAKYALANEFGIAGVGVWTFGEIPSLPDKNARAMWDALRGAVQKGRRS